MQCPVVLVGPGGRDEIHLNSAAGLLPDWLGLEQEQWLPVRTSSSPGNVPEGGDRHDRLENKASPVAPVNRGSSGEEGHAARPMMVVHDRDGNCWLCPIDVDENGDLAAQGCWRCEGFLSARDAPEDGDT